VPSFIEDPRRRAVEPPVRYFISNLPKQPWTHQTASMALPHPYAGKLLATPRSNPLACANAGQRSFEMKHQRDFETSSQGLREALRVNSLIRDLDRIVLLIDSDIAREEKESGVSDLSNAVYSLAARLLRVRRDNLSHTIASLQTRVAALERTNG
jgi:hypothetical protein